MYIQFTLFAVKTPLRGYYEKKMAIKFGIHRCYVVEKELRHPFLAGYFSRCPKKYFIATINTIKE